MLKYIIHECTKVQTLGVMSSCHCGQTLLESITNGNSRKSTHNQLSFLHHHTGKNVHYHMVNTMMHMHTFCRKMPNCTYGLQWKEWCPRKGRAPRRGAWRRSRPLSPEWPAAAPVLAVSETCAWVSEVEARR